MRRFLPGTVGAEAYAPSVTAGDEVRNLLGRYCEAIDLGDFGALGALFAHGTLADEQGRPLARGADEVAAFYRRGTRLHDGVPATKHLTVNTILDLDEPAGVATARSSYVALQRTDALALQPIIAGRYVDRFARDDDGWHFVERRFHVDLVGELGEHLRYELS
jgi:hypothetical protein